jgi:two-component system sensor histidine kinase KdpD
VHPALIEQAFFNQLDNAASFSPPGQPISWSARRQDAHWLIDIGDRGPGIPAAERLRVFEMFHALERGDRRPAGTGLGLTICQGIVAAHGGSIEALPADAGTGTLMRIRFPVGDPPGERAGEDSV